MLPGNAGPVVELVRPPVMDGTEVTGVEVRPCALKLLPSVGAAGPAGSVVAGRVMALVPEPSVVGGSDKVPSGLIIAPVVVVDTVPVAVLLSVLPAAPVDVATVDTVCVK